jgi:predicted lipoprotein with Yx(FWY)xxD motif
VTRTATLLAALAALVTGALLFVLLTRSPANHGGPDRSAAADRPPDVLVRRTHLGRILVDRRGHTLYLFRADHRGRSACSGACARVWPPLIVGGQPRAGAGVSAAALTTTRRRDGSLQAVYHGHPLYDMSADTAPGQTAGQGFLGTWFVVAPSGHQIGKAHGGGEY